MGDEILEKYPELANAPSDLIFELILNLAEAATSSARMRCFKTASFRVKKVELMFAGREVWIEVQLENLLALVKAGNCSQALTMAQHLGSPVSGLSFTQDGLEGRC